MTETIVSEAAEPKGIAGWLLIPLLQLIATPVASIFNVVKELRAGTPPQLSTAFTAHPAYAFAAPVPGLIGGVAFVFGLYCLWQFLEQKRRTPSLMIGWYILNVLTILSTSIYLHVLPRNAVNAVPLFQAYSANNRDLFTLAFVIVLNAILIAYFTRSRRVQNTFVC